MEKFLNGRDSRIAFYVEEFTQKEGAPAVAEMWQNPYVLRVLGLAFERKADAPSYWKQTKVKGSGRRFGVISRACRARCSPELSYTPMRQH
jgi:hypothetical protein